MFLCAFLLEATPFLAWNSFRRSIFVFFVFLFYFIFSYFSLLKLHPQQQGVVLQTKIKISGQKKNGENMRGFFLKLRVFLVVVFLFVLQTRGTPLRETKRVGGISRKWLVKVWWVDRAFFAVVLPPPLVLDKSCCFPPIWGHLWWAFKAGRKNVKWENNVGKTSSA